LEAFGILDSSMPLPIYELSLLLSGCFAVGFGYATVCYLVNENLPPVAAF